MSSYWLDTDTLVWANNNAYPLASKVGAPFWALIEEGFDSGLIKMSRYVYKEITDGRSEKDNLAQWLGRRERLCLSSTKEIQAFSKRIGNYLYSGSHRYDVRWVNRFATGADAWLIAYAAVDGGAVVSKEESAPDGAKPKVPDVCNHFGVRCIHLNKLLFCLERGIPPECCTEPFRD